VAFRGTFDHSLDAKNRLTVPSRFRAQLADGVVLAQDLDHCAAIWSPPAFERYVSDALGQFAPLSEEARALTRYFQANSQDTELDSAGRVMFPPWLMAHAGLRKEVFVTGAGDHLEVWDRETWSEHNGALADRVRQITSTLGHAR
jgi:MraZ protein